VNSRNLSKRYELSDAATVTRRTLTLKRKTAAPTHVVSGDGLGAFLLNECMSKTFLGIVCGTPRAVNVVSNFVNEDIVEKKVTYGITVMAAKFKRMSAEKNTLAPVEAIAAK